jgi:LCP family protein required for cell wall assembly
MSDEEDRDESTEEYLLGGIDEDSDPETASETPAEPPVEMPIEQSAGQPAEPNNLPADAGSAADPEPPPADSDPGESGDSVSPVDGDSGYEDQPTEEVFALEAKLREGDEEVPELDPVFRAALLESPESAAAPAADTPDQTADVGVAAAAAAGGESGSGEGGAGGSEEADDDHGTDDDEFFVTEEQSAILTAAARSEVHQVIETARKTGEPFDPARPPASGDFEKPPRRKGIFWRFALATLIIVFAFGGATSASILNQLDDITERLGDPEFEKISEKILPPNNGGPQTIAILGSDVRTGGGAPEGDPGRSDTTILLRFDPDTDQIAMLSIPRDLEVDIPGFGTDKFNAAYSYGGTKLTLKTIKQETGLDVNHVINVDFQGFASVVDAIGCVFVDVDRDYFNSNEGVAASEQYAEIDIDAGYQKLCGPDALEFARYRHTDTDLVRASRQQDLLGEVRNRLSFGEIFSRRNELLDAFTENTRSDISGSKEALELLSLLFDSRNARVVEVKFPATLGPSYVTATPAEIDGAVEKFLGFQDAEGPVGTLAEGSGKNQAKKRAKEKARKQNDEIISKGVPGKDGDGLIDASQAGLDEAVKVQGQRKSKNFSIFYTTRLPSATGYADGGRAYHLRDLDKNSHAAYRMVMFLEASDGLHYFGLQGIRGWQDPPILEAPHEELKIDGRDFRVYTEGDRIRLISWFDSGNTYWISNSLLLTLTNDQMLGMARATRAITPN